MNHAIKIDPRNQLEIDLSKASDAETPRERALGRIGVRKLVEQMLKAADTNRIDRGAYRSLYAFVQQLADPDGIGPAADLAAIRQRARTLLALVPEPAEESI